MYGSSAANGGPVNRVRREPAVGGSLNNSRSNSRSRDEKNPVVARQTSVSRLYGAKKPAAQKQSTQIPSQLAGVPRKALGGAKAATVLEQQVHHGESMEEKIEKLQNLLKAAKNGQ